MKPQPVIEIPLTNSPLKALVDKSDFAKISKHTWGLKMTKWGPKARSNTKGVYMHRLIKPGHVMVDHHDHNGLNNTRINLRPCTALENNANARKKKGSSRFKGVYWRASCKKWLAQIKRNYQWHYLGMHLVEEDAARAYNRAAKRLFGRFAWLNQI